jgi:hypothetical protein
MNPYFIMNQVQELHRSLPVGMRRNRFDSDGHLGIFTAKLAHKKGYRGYFFTGFFFCIIGLLYVIGLPLAKDCVACERQARVKEEKAVEA